MWCTWIDRDTDLYREKYIDADIQFISISVSISRTLA